MRELNLDSAIREILDVRAQEYNGANPPFFFIAGAGLPHPTIETANGLLEECKAAAIAQGRSAQPASQDRIDVYSHWMEAAFPHPEQRRRYLQKKIQNKKISPRPYDSRTFCKTGKLRERLSLPISMIS